MAVAERDGAIYRPEGLEVEAVQRFLQERGSIRGFPGARDLPSAEALELDCDVLIPAALESQITVDNASRIRARIVAEGANGPTTFDGERVLLERGVLVIPDILANAGGVIVSYFEWVQDLQNFFWTEDEVNNKLNGMLTRAFHEVLKLSQKEHVSLRLAALMIAVQRVGRAMLLRGLYA